MPAYLGILEKDADSVWGVWFPDLPGCVAAGVTEQEAIRNAAAALDDWVVYVAERSNLPPASPIEALLANDDVRATEASRVAFRSVSARLG